MEQFANREMIILARESRGLNQGVLAKKIGMTAPNLSRIERGEINIYPKHVYSIAEATGYPPNFFYQAGSIVPENLAYRKNEKLPANLLTPIHAQVNIIRQHAQLVTKALHIEKPALPAWQVTADETPQRIARKLRHKWSMNTPVVDNMVATVESKGILVVAFPFPTTRVDSKTVWTEEGFPVICLNSLQLGDRQRFSLAFELGQIIMHRSGVFNEERDISHEANLFAAEFLMPEYEIRPDFNNDIKVPLLAELKTKWKVSMIALLYRADDLGFLTKNQKQWLLQRFNAMRIRRREPVELDIPVEEPKLMKQYLAQYKTKAKLSTSQVAAALCLHVPEFLKLYG